MALNFKSNTKAPAKYPNSNSDLEFNFRNNQLNQGEKTTHRELFEYVSFTIEESKGSSTENLNEKSGDP